MLRTIFNLGSPSILPGLCAVGECLDPNTSPCLRCLPRGDQPRTRWWATGILIHPRVVLTVAHSPRSGTILGDRVLLPGLPRPVTTPDTMIPATRRKPTKGESPNAGFPERVLCVQRIHDHPKSTYRGYDARLLILMEIPGIKGELEDRRCRLLEYNRDRMADFRIDGFANLTDPGSSLPHPRCSRPARTAKDAHNEETHGHLLSREFVITPKPADEEGHETTKGPEDAQESGISEGPTAAFGDSGAPVWMPASKHDPAPRAVGMYVRRSLNRPAMTNPDLVVLAWNANLKDWVEDMMDRYNLPLGN